VVNAVTLELAPDQVEKLDLARSIGSLSLVLRNQVDPQPANTAGATRESVLGLPPVAPVAAAIAAPRLQAPAPVRIAAPARAPRQDAVLVIRGLDAAPQAF
jgi:pilus assembly protein CpaB